MSTATSRATGCLACGNNDGRFESEEHVIALTLGNSVDSGLVEDELTIPPGEVCDKCNGRRLSLRDSALAAWPPISVFRSLAQIRNRRGRLVDAVEATRWHIELDRDDPCIFRLDAFASTGPASGRDEVARALCKIALETRWLEDATDARSSRWDSVAAAAIGGPLPGPLSIGVIKPAELADIDLTPSSNVLVSDEAGPLRLACQAWVVGLGLALVIGSSPPPIPNSEWWGLDPQTNSLEGRGSMWLSVHGRAKTARRLDAPPTEERRGRYARLPTHDERTDLRLGPPRS